jgi:hypothetical protein
MCVEDQLEQVEDEKENQEFSVEEVIEDKSNDDGLKSHYNLRPNRARDYSHKYSFLSVHAGIKRWGG